MGNRLCCGGSCFCDSRNENPRLAETPKKAVKQKSCPSIFQRKKKMGSQPRRTLKQQQQQKQNGTKGHDTTGLVCERVLRQPASQERSQGLRSEDSSLHYAVIQVCSHPQPRSAQEVKHLQSENATEYATLCFPQATPCYDSKNGTLV